MTGSWDNTARLWNLDTGQQVQSLKSENTFPGLPEIPSAVTSVTFSPDGKSVLTGGTDATARLWDAISGSQIRTFDGHTDSVMSVAFSRDGLLALTGSADKTARMWDVATGRQLRSFEGHTDWVASVAFSDDGRLILTGSHDGTARLWDASTNQQLFSFKEPTLANVSSVWVNSVAFSPDGGKALVGGSGGSARLWDTSTGKLLRTFEQGAVSSVAYSPSGALRLLIGSMGIGADGDPGVTNTVRIWDETTGQPLVSVKGNTNRVAAVAFSQDGRFLLTGGDDSTTRVWDAASGQQVATLLGSEKGAWTVVDPLGRFDTSDLDGGAPLAWVVSNDPLHALPLEIFMRDYYTPGLLARLLKGEKLPPAKSIAEIKNRVQPEVKVVSVTPSAHAPGRVDLLVHASSQTDAKGITSGLQDLRLFRDGQMVAGGYLEGPLNDGDFLFRNVMLKSDATNVTWTAYAFNAERIKSATASLDYHPKSAVAATAVKRRAFLVQIGVNHYAAGSCELNFSVNDAEKMSAALTERLKAQGFVPEPVLLESRAGSDAMGAAKDRIHRQLVEVAAKATPDDVFFLSFSGHGYSAADGRFYLLPSDVKGSCHGVTEAMLQTAISADELAEWLRPIDAGELTFVLDACHSAESVEANDFKPGPMGSRGLGQLAYDKRMRILAASQSDGTAQEYASLQQGLLSYVLTHEGLQAGKADWKPVDKKIMVGEWLAYAAQTVPNFAVAPDKIVASKSAGQRHSPESSRSAFQIPALFDFSKTDSLVLQ